jgi:hypothetical protein
VATSEDLADAAEQLRSLLEIGSLNQELPVG